jgi:hypothetical protein
VRFIPACVASGRTIDLDADDQRVVVHVRAPDLVLLMRAGDGGGGGRFDSQPCCHIEMTRAGCGDPLTLPTVASTKSPGHFGFFTTIFSSFSGPDQTSTFCRAWQVNSTHAERAKIQHRNWCAPTTKVSRGMLEAELLDREHMSRTRQDGIPVLFEDPDIQLMGALTTYKPGMLLRARSPLLSRRTLRSTDTRPGEGMHAVKVDEGQHP